MFVTSRSNKLLVSAGHWDNSFRVESLEKGKTIARVAYHQGAWCCLYVLINGEEGVVGESVMAGTDRGVRTSSPHVFEIRTQTLVVYRSFDILPKCMYTCVPQWWCLCLCSP